MESSLAKNREADGDREYLAGARDIHEADIAFQKRVRDIYVEQARMDSSFIVIDCSDKDGRMLPAELIFEKIKTVYENHPKD